MTDQEILSLITGEFSKLNDRLERLENFFPSEPNRKKRIRKNKKEAFIMKSLKKTLR